MTFYRKYLRDDLNDCAEKCLVQYGINQSPSDVSLSQYASAVHLYLRCEIEYRHTGSDLQKPYKTWKYGGDCGDLAVLAASLLFSVQVPFRILTVESPQIDSEHAVPELGVPIEYGYSQSGFEKGVERFDANQQVKCTTLSCTLNDGFAWYPMCSRYCEFVGDITLFKRDEFVRGNSSSWTWTERSFRSHDIVSDGKQVVSGSTF
jgi:hypothetical protein